MVQGLVLKSRACAFRAHSLKLSVQAPGTMRRSHVLNPERKSQGHFPREKQKRRFEKATLQLDRHYFLYSRATSGKNQKSDLRLYGHIVTAQGQPEGRIRKVIYSWTVVTSLPRGQLKGITRKVIYGLTVAISIYENHTTSNPKVYLLLDSCKYVIIRTFSLTCLAA